MGFIGLVIMGTLLYLAKKKEKAQFEAFANEMEFEKQEKQKRHMFEKTFAQIINVITRQPDAEELVESLFQFRLIKGKLEKKQAEMDTETKHTFERIVHERMPNLLESYFQLSEANQKNEKITLLRSIQTMQEELKSIEETLEKKKLNQFQKWANIK